MRHLTLMRRAQTQLIERATGTMRMSPKAFGPQAVSLSLQSEFERHATVVVESPIDLDPASPSFGSVKSILGITPLGDFTL